MRTLSLKFSFDLKTIRKAIVLTTGKTPSHSQIRKKFLDREPIDVTEDFLRSNVGEKDTLQLCLSMVALMVAKDMEQEARAKELAKTPRPKSRFQQRLDNLMNKK